MKRQKVQASERFSDGKPPTKAAPTVAVSRPTHDQIYLMDRINLSAERGHLTLPAVVKLNKKYGVAAVCNAMRLLRGFPPEDGVVSAYAYLERLCVVVGESA